MNRKIISTMGLIVCALVGYWAWTNLGGGEGVMSNVLRNAVVGALVPLGLYSALMLFTSDSRSQSDTKKDQKERSEP